MKTRIIIVIILLFTLSSCLNSYEKEIIDEYELYKYELKSLKFK